MPSCCIKNCKSCTTAGYTASKGTKFFTFPREIAIRQQWLNACQIKESDRNVDVARICSIHFKENCFELVKTKPKLKNQPVKEILRLTKGSIPTKFLNLEKKPVRRTSQSKKDNNKIKVPKKSSIVPTCTEFVHYAQQKQRLSQEETVTKMETDVAQNMEEDVKNMERDTLQDTKEKVTKNIDKVATQNMEKQSKAIKQQVKQGIDRIDDNLMQLRISQQLNLKLLDENQNLVERNRKLLDKNKNLEERIQDLSTQVSQLQAEIKNLTMKNKHKEAKTIAIAALRKISCIPNLSSEEIARAVSLL
ncbi:uncharacterized protein [Temnothorax nylanderi]|uniref:uncharacterized protein n=1 Tax=Temnothorax nylanderi TaxID=102681 RepID=UPI003A884173